MPKQYNPHVKHREAGEELECAVESIHTPALNIVKFQNPSTANCERALRSPTCIRLDWEDLKCFEVVEHQFESWGVTFKNAIALHPSNPAFPARSGITVLMAAPKSGLLEAKFFKPVSFVGGFVTSSRRIILSAYDAADQLLGQTEVSGANLAGSNSQFLPNTFLSLDISGIQRITFYSFDGQFTLDDFSFSF